MQQEERPGRPLEPDYETPACSNNGLAKRFFCSPRTERAFRFVSMLPVAMYLAYQNPQDYNFAYLVVVFYVIYSALMPPSPSGGVMALTMGLPSALLAVSCSNIIFLVVIKMVEHKMAAASIDVYVIVSLFIAACFFSVLKLGALGPMMQIGLFAGIYTLASVLILMYTTVRDGVEIDLPPASLQYVVGQLDSIVINLSKAGLKNLAALLRFLFAALVNSLPCHVIEVDATTGALTILDAVCDFNVPERILDVDSSLTPLVGLPVSLRASSAKGLWIRLYPGTWALRLMWVGKRHFSMVQGLLVSGSIALGLFFVASIIPPPRLMKSLFRGGVVTSVKTLKNTDITWATDFMLLDRKEVLDNGIVLPPKNEGVRPSALRKRKRSTFRTHQPAAGGVTTEQVALRTDDLKGPMLLSLFEHLIFSPFGVNTFLVGPETLKAMKKVAIDIGYLSEMTKSKMTPRGLVRRHTETPIKNQVVLQWMRQAVIDSLRLAQIVETSLGLKNAHNAEKSQRGLMTDTSVRLQYEMQRVQIRKSQFQEVYQRAIIDALSEERDACEASLMACQFGNAMLDSQLHLAEAADKWLDRQLNRSFRSLLLSFAGIFAPLGLFIISMISPWIRGAKRLGRLCMKSLRNPEMPQTSFVKSTPRATSQSEASPFGAQLRPLRDFGRFSGWSSVASRLKSRERRHGLTEAYSFWICLRFVIGATFIFALVILMPSYSQKKWLGGKDEPIFISGLPANFVLLQAPILRISKTAAWTFLGFLTTFICTMEGTMKRAMLRMIGVVTGSGMAWFCLLAFPHSGIAQCIWMVVVDFIVVWMSAHPTSPLAGFHPSWGYSAQLFTYQQAIIVCETTILAPRYTRNEITVDRFLSQSIGIFTAVALSVVVIPTRAGPAVRLHLSDAVYSMSQTTRALVELFSVPESIYRLDSEAAEKKKANSWLTYYELYAQNLSGDIESANRYRADNSLLSNFAPLKNHPALDVVYAASQRLSIIREEAHGALTSLWSGAKPEKPESALPLGEASSHTISIYADQSPPDENSPPNTSRGVLHDRDTKTSPEPAFFEQSSIHRASPPEDRFLHANSFRTERMVTPVSAHFSIPYEMTSCGIQTTETGAHPEILLAPIAPSPVSSPTRQQSLGSVELSIGRAVLAERDVATRQAEMLEEENRKQRDASEVLAKRIQDLENQLAAQENASSILLTRTAPRLEAAREVHDEFLEQLEKTRRWLENEADEGRYDESLAAMVAVFERFYIVLENGLQWGGRKQRSAFPMLSSEFEEACLKALYWLEQMTNQISTRAAAEIALLRPRCSAPEHPLVDTSEDAYSLFCGRWQSEDEKSQRIVGAALRMRTLTHFLSLELLELTRVVNIITSELWDKARLRSSQTTKTQRL